MSLLCGRCKNEYYSPYTRKPLTEEDLRGEERPHSPEIAKIYYEMDKGGRWRPAFVETRDDEKRPVGEKEGKICGNCHSKEKQKKRHEKKLKEEHERKLKEEAEKLKEEK